MDARSTPIINRDFSSHKNSETSVSSEDLLTSSEHLFSAHDTIDLSPDMKQSDKDYVRISKQEYEEIKSRVSAIENRLSREFTDVIPRVQPLQQVQNVYEQTLEEVAMLHCPNSDHLARRLSKELKIRPNEEAKIIRSPSARKIGSIRRRSKENITKLVRHKSWNVSSQSQSSQNTDRFYPYVGLTRRQRTSTAKPDLAAQKSANEWDASASEQSLNNVSDSSQKYRLRKRASLIPDYSAEKPISKIPARRSLNITINNSWDNTASENSMNITLNSSGKSNNSVLARCYQNVTCRNRKPSPPQSQQKWRSAAAFFMDKTGELEKTSQTGRPSVNKLRRQNAGAVLAKAKLFESSSDKSSERQEKAANTGFARKPRISGQQNKPQRSVALVKPKMQSPVVSPNIPVRVTRNIEVSSVPSKSHRLNIPSNSEFESWRNARKTTPPVKNVVSPRSALMKTPQIPVLKKPLCTPKTSRLPALSNDLRKTNTPLKAVHISPRRRSPRLKQRV